MAFAAKSKVIEIDTSQVAPRPLMDMNIVHLLCFGFLRRNFPKSVNPRDIAMILTRYIELLFKLSFFNHDSADHHCHSLVIFAHNILSQNFFNLKRYSNTHGISMMSVKLLHHKCNNKFYSNNGYSIECGIIGLIKNTHLQNIDASNVVATIMANKQARDHYSSKLSKNLLMLKQKTTRFARNNNEMDGENGDSVKLSNLQNNYVFKDFLSYYVSLWHFQSSRYYLSFGMNDKSMAENMRETKVIYDNDLKIGDSCRVAGNDRSKRGKVKYIGNDGLIGIELDLWTRGAGNGTLNGKQYFTTQDGRGIFAQRTNVLLIKNKNKNENNNNNDNNKGSNNDESKNDGSKNSENEMNFIEMNDTINVCVNNINGNLTFHKNGDLSTKLGNVSLELDFDRFEYFFAMSSVCCNDNDQMPFRFDVSMNI